MKTGHSRDGKHRHTWRGKAGLPPPPRKTEKRTGIKRMPRERTAATLPLSERHQRVLSLLGPHPVRAALIASETGLKYNSTVSTLYALQDRGLVERVPERGWKRNRPQGGGGG